jgi:hypothetical protein
MTFVDSIPRWIKKPLKRIRAVPYYGTQRFCPVCGKFSRRFVRHGLVPREDARCVHCGALERHRLLWLYLQRKTDLFKPPKRKTLHVAPEPCLETHFRERLGDAYVTADLQDPHAMMRMDITNIHLPDAAFDVIYCSHVLEHVIDDKKAIREFPSDPETRGLGDLAGADYC